MNRFTIVSLKTVIITSAITYVLLSLSVYHFLLKCEQSTNVSYMVNHHRGLSGPSIEIDKDNHIIAVDISEPRNPNKSDAKDVSETNSVKRFDCDEFGLPRPVEAPTALLDRLCPETPPSLVGRLAININTTSTDVLNKTALKLLKPGGFYKPHQCIATERTAVIVPYRDRARHLKTLLFHLHTVLQRQQLQYGIFVVEMAYPTQFNRGLLANVGFLSAHDIQNFTCYIIHDVDQLPADDRNLYRCSDNPRHLSVSSSKYGFKLPYGHYNGGIVAFTPTQFIRINGFSNSYFGWGKEDDDLHKRIMLSKYKVDRPDPDVGVYMEIPHRRDGTNPDNPMKDGLYQNTGSLYKKDGLNSVLYKRLAMEFRPLYTWVYVNTSESLIMGRLDGIYARINQEIRKKAGT